MTAQPAAERAASDGDGLEEALRTLSPSLSRVIRLSFEKELTRDAIASELGIPPGTVASRMRTAKTQLKALLCAEHVESSKKVLHL